MSLMAFQKGLQLQRVSGDLRGIRIYESRILSGFMGSQEVSAQRGPKRPQRRFKGS